MVRTSFLATLCAAVLAMHSPATVPATAAVRASVETCPWIGSTAPADARARDVAAQMTLDEKISVLGLTASPDGYANHVPAIPRLCLPRLTLHDGPAGVAGGFTGVTQLPAPIAVAASFDRSVAARYGRIQGTEAWGKGITVLQGPVLDIARVPQSGRTFEGYGEDPHLAAELGVANIRGIQATGVMANAKHFVANNQETDRRTINAVIAERPLREIYFPPFEAAVRKGDVASAMCAYNRVNGVHACESSGLLQDVLKDEYGFPGFVRSDFGAVHDVAAAYGAGMDQAKPAAGAELQAAVQAGRVPLSRVDDAVRRVLGQMFRFGVVDRPSPGGPDAVVTSPQHALAGGAIAEQGAVLLKNAGAALPLAGSLESIAVIGPGGGGNPFSAGGGSAYVIPPYVVTPYEAIRDRAGGDVRVTYTQGVDPTGALPAVPETAFTPPSGVAHGLLGEYWNNRSESGTPVLTRTDPNVDFVWGRGPTAVSPGLGVNATNWSARWTGTLTAPVSGTYTFSLTSDDGSSLFIDGTSVVDNGGSHSVHTRSGTIVLSAGQAYQVRVHYFNGAGGDQVRLGWMPPGADPYADAAQAAQRADVAIVFAGDEEREATDRVDLSLPFGQDGLIAAVASANPNTIVVLGTGSAVNMPWLASVEAVVQAWYPGQETGNAIAAVIFGDVNPSGKLPLTFPKRAADVPAHTPAQWPGVRGNAEYSEGLQVGYRWYDAQGIEPLFPFGHGLSYTSFRIDRVVTRPRRLNPFGRLTVGARVTNTGRRAGSQVVQVYVALPARTNEPPKRLVGFEKVTLGAGETAGVTFRLDARDLSYWDEIAHGWVLARGDYVVMVGSSSREITARRTVHVARSIGPRYVRLDAPEVAEQASTVDVTASFTNESTRAVRDARLSLSTPANWTASAASPSSFARVEPDQTVRTTWRVAVPATAGPDAHRLTATATYRAERGAQGSSRGTAVLTVPYPSLADAYDNVGITDDADPTPGNFDGAGNSYSAQALAAAGLTPGSTITAGGISFTWPSVPAGMKDNVAMQGQVIRVTGTGHVLGVLGAATSGARSGTGTLFYTDGSAQTFALALADWISTTPASGGDLIATLPYLNRTTDRPQRTVSVFAAYVPLEAGKTLRAVRLPDAGRFGMHAFAVAVGGVAPATDGDGRPKRSWTPAAVAKPKAGSAGATASTPGSRRASSAWGGGDR